MKSSPLCSGWQLAHSRLEPGLIMYVACSPFRAAIRHAISPWQDRHWKVGFPVESSWQFEHSVTPLIDWWARERGPGEICPAAGIEIHTILSTRHPRIPGFARLQIAFTRRVFTTVVFVSTTQNIAVVCASSTLGLKVRMNMLRGFLYPLSMPRLPPLRWRFDEH